MSISGWLPTSSVSVVLLSDTPVGVGELSLLQAEKVKISAISVISADASIDMCLLMFAPLGKEVENQEN
jgi:hypothetical protein